MPEKLVSTFNCTVLTNHLHHCNCILSIFLPLLDSSIKSPPHSATNLMLLERDKQAQFFVAIEKNIITDLIAQTQHDLHTE